MILKKRKQKGFTLVELLIVVAIIGVLATIGIPTFQKMVQKSKKSEAKVALGAIYTSEVAFWSEYGTYGTNLNGIGFDLTGAGPNRIYTVGFPSYATIEPSKTGSNVGIALNNAFPSYYTGTYNYEYMATKTPTAFTAVDAFDTTGGATFTASAGGQISPVAGAPADVWTMDNTRALANIQDGVQ